jgi:hypothetical protein
MVASHDGVTTTEKPPLREVPVAREDPPTFLKCAFNQRLIRDRAFVGGVIAKHAKPTSQAAKHCIRDEYVR